MYSSQDLAVLVAVADTGSLRGAATALARTQPAVTQAVQRLEEAVGFPLLDRSSYRARFTERGEIFVKRARVAVGQVKSLERTAMLLSHGVEPRVRIAVHEAIPREAWVDLIKGVSSRFPNTAVELEAGEGGVPVRRLMDGDAEFALLLLAYPDRYGTSVESKTLGEVEFVNVVRAELAERLHEEPASIPHVVAEAFDEPPNYGVADGQAAWRFSNHRMKADAILAGLGWGSLPRFMVEAQLADGALAPLSRLGSRERGARPYSLYRKRDRPLGPVSTFIWESVEERSG